MDRRLSDDFLGEAAALGDMTLGLPGFVLGVGANLGATTVGMLAGEDPKTAYQGGRRAMERVAAPSMSLIRDRLPPHLARSYDESKLMAALHWLMAGIEKGGANIEKRTGIPQEGVQSLADVAMLGAPQMFRALKDAKPQTQMGVAAGAGTVAGLGMDEPGPEAAVMAGILAGKKGAQRYGGPVAERFAAGEVAAAEGVPSQRLWREHGYAQGKEGGGRFEIPDQASELFVPDDGRFQGPAGEVLKHEELFAAYPELWKTPVELEIGGLESSGRYEPATGRVSVKGMDAKEARSNLLHELQHAVQKAEGHPGGTNLRRAGGMDKYLQEAGEQEAHNVQRRLADPDLMKFEPSMSESLPRELQVISEDPGAAQLVLEGFEKRRKAQLAKEGISKQFEAQMPRLSKLAESLQPASIPKLEASPSVVPLMKLEATGPKIKEMLGQEEAHFGADVAKIYGPSTFEHELGGITAPIRGVARDFASPEEAKKALLRHLLNYYGKLEKAPSYKYSATPVRPQISEFASPESARRSWRVVPKEPK